MHHNVRVDFGKACSVFSSLLLACALSPSVVSSALPPEQLRVLARVSRAAATGNALKLHQLLSLSGQHDKAAFVYGEFPPGSQRTPLHYALAGCHNECEQGRLTTIPPQHAKKWMTRNATDNATAISSAYLTVIQTLIADRRTDLTLWCPIVDAIHLRNRPAVLALARGSTAHELRSCLGEINIDGDTLLHVMARSKSSGFGRFFVRHDLAGNRPLSNASSIADVMALLGLDSTMARAIEQTRLQIEDQLLASTNDNLNTSVYERRVSKNALDAANLAWDLEFVLLCSLRAALQPKQNMGTHDTADLQTDNKTAKRGQFHCDASKRSERRENIGSDNGSRLRKGQEWRRRWLEERNGQNLTALLVACRERQPVAITALLRAGALPNVVDTFGRSCGHLIMPNPLSKDSMLALHQTSSQLARAWRAWKLGGGNTSSVSPNLEQGSCTSQPSASHSSTRSLETGVNREYDLAPSTGGAGWSGTTPMVHSVLRRYCAYCNSKNANIDSNTTAARDALQSARWFAFLRGPQKMGGGFLERTIPQIDAWQLSNRDFKFHFLERSPLLLRHAMLTKGWMRLGVPPEVGSTSPKKQCWSRSALLRRQGHISVMVGKIPYADSYGVHYERQTLRHFVTQHMRPFNSSQHDADIFPDELRSLVPPYVFDSGVLHDEMHEPQRRSHVRRRRTLGKELSNALHGANEAMQSNMMQNATLRVLLKQWMLGPALSGAQPHFHGAAWNALVQGLKLWLIFPPQYAFFSNLTALEVSLLDIL